MYLTCYVLRVMRVMLWPGPAEVFATPRLLFAMFLHRRGHHRHPPLGQRPGDTHRKHQSYQDVNVSGALPINEYNTLEPLEAKASHLDWAESVQSFTGFPHFTVRPWRRYFANWVRQGLVAGAGGGYWLTHQAINIKLSHIRIKSIYIQAHNLSNKTIA